MPYGPILPRASSLSEVLRIGRGTVQQVYLYPDSRSNGKGVKRLLERGDEADVVLDAAGDPDKTVPDLEPVLGTHVGVGHDGGAGDDALDRAEVLTQAPGPVD